MNITRVVGTLIVRRIATLYELQTIYSYEDALDMMEAVLVSNYNSSVLMEEVSKNSDKRH